MRELFVIAALAGAALHFFWYTHTVALRLWELTGGVQREGRLTLYGATDWAWTVPAHLPAGLLFSAGLGGLGLLLLAGSLVAGLAAAEFLQTCPDRRAVGPSGGGSGCSWRAGAGCPFRPRRAGSTSGPRCTDRAMIPAVGRLAREAWSRNTPEPPAPAPARAARSRSSSPCPSPSGRPPSYPPTGSLTVRRTPTRASPLEKPPPWPPPSAERPALWCTWTSRPRHYAAKGRLDFLAAARRLTRDHGRLGVRFFVVEREHAPETRAWLNRLGDPRLDRLGWGMRGYGAAIWLEFGRVADVITAIVWPTRDVNPDIVGQTLALWDGRP